MRKETIQVTRSSMPPLEEYVEEIKDIWETRWLTHTGPKHQKLNEELCRYLSVPYLSLFANGHLALEAALSLLPTGGEVITTPFTFASTTQAIVHCGLNPTFCDIEEETYTMDPDKIESLITEKTCAIVPVHVYGNICNWEGIEKIAQKYHLKVIYDAAHAFGETINGKSAAALGDISMFSFHATKVYHTVEGGALTYVEGSLSKEFAAWRQFGMYGKEDAEIIGTNAKMTEFHAAMGLCNLRHIDEQILFRKEAVLRYRERLGGIAGIYLCPEKPGIRYNYAYFPVRFLPEQFGETRDAVSQRLERNGTYSRKYFFPLTSAFQVYQTRFSIQETPIAKTICEQVITLPLFADITLEQVDHICDIIVEGRQ